MWVEVRCMRLRTVSIAAVVCLATTVPAHAEYAAGVQLFRFKGIRISESSGLAESWRTPGIYWTHNDSPDVGPNLLGNFFGVGPDGTTITEFSLRGSVNVDWEDMAIGPGSSGEASSLYFADFGDNYEARPFVVIYEVSEPAVNPATPVVDIVPTAVHVLAYEDGPHNAETFLVDPRDGSFAIVTKDNDGHSGLYEVAVPAPPGPPRLMARTAELDVTAIATGSSLTTTGGAIAPDRSRLVIRTYHEAFEWELGTQTLAAALSAPPLRIALPTTQQGEAITYTADSVALLTSSEGTFGPVHRLDPL